MVVQENRIQPLPERGKGKLQHPIMSCCPEAAEKFDLTMILGPPKLTRWPSLMQTASQTKVPVMIWGESGTGKEFIAQTIHELSDRANSGRFVKFSCKGLLPALLEAELFGHERKQAAEEAEANIGLLEMAKGGTLFLDEIDDLSVMTQMKLLRILRERKFGRLGGLETLPFDVRLITGANGNLEAKVKSRLFREALYYRLNVISIFLPPLRDRKEDIPMLLKYFLQKLNDESGKNKCVSEAAMERLMNYSWPGNLDELEFAIERAYVLSKTENLTPEFFPVPESKDEGMNPLFSFTDPSEALGNLPEAVENLEKKLISEAMKQAHGIQRRASKLLGVSERILGYKLRRYGYK